MLLANETVAEDYYWQELPFVYRVHEAPDEEKMQAACACLSIILDIPCIIGVNEVRPKEIQKVAWQRLKAHRKRPLISRLTLRSMKQAKYTPENAGHFGLAASYYTHFTSPIRRYPDLQIHRIIKDNLRGRMTPEKRAHYEAILDRSDKTVQ